MRYLNDVVDADHGKLKLLIRPVRGFKTLKTAYVTIKGFEVVRALRKGQAGLFALQDGIVREARFDERAFGFGPCALTEVMVLLQDRLASAEAQGEHIASPTTSPLRQVCNRAGASSVVSFARKCAASTTAEPANRESGTARGRPAQPSPSMASIRRFSSSSSRSSRSA